MDTGVMPTKSEGLMAMPAEPRTEKRYPTLCIDGGSALFDALKDVDADTMLDFKGTCRVKLVSIAGKQEGDNSYSNRIELEVTDLTPVDLPDKDFGE